MYREQQRFFIPAKKNISRSKGNAEKKLKWLRTEERNELGNKSCDKKKLEKE